MSKSDNPHKIKAAHSRRKWNPTLQRRPRGLGMSIKRQRGDTARNMQVKGTMTMKRTGLLIATVMLMTTCGLTIVWAEDQDTSLQAAIAERDKTISELEVEINKMKAGATRAYLSKLCGELRIAESRIAELESDRNKAKPANANTVGADYDFQIKEFDFEWIVTKSGDAKLLVEKTHETTVIRLRQDMDSLSILPKDAEPIGIALSKADDFWAAMRGSDKDVQESVEVGKYEVTFRHSPQYGFSVWVQESGRYFMSNVSLDREAANLFAPHMQKAQEMATFVDQKITF